MNTSAVESAATVPPAKVWRGAATGILLLAVSGGIFYKVITTSQEGSRRAAVAAEQAAVEEKLDDFFAHQAQPLLAAAREKDLQAAAKALESIDGMFAKYEQGVPKFADDMTGWGTRFKILWRKGVETLERKDEHTWTQAIVKEKFAARVMSDAQLEKDLTEVMKQFAFDMHANRNEMLASMQSELDASQLPVSVKSVALKDFKSAFDQRLAGLLQKMPNQSLIIGVGSLAAGIAAEEAVRNIVRAIVAQMAGRLAATALASGGAAGGAAAAGASGGTAVAPGVGTVIGLAGGFIVGALIDWWMTDEFEEKLSAQCVEFLSATKNQLVSGDQGLKAFFVSHVDQASKAYEKAVGESLHAPLP